MKGRPVISAGRLLRFHMTETTAQVDPPQLAYSRQALPWYRRRWFQRRLIVIATLGAVIALSVMWGPKAWHKVRLFRWQAGCMAYTAPADMVVYEEDATAGAKLLELG